MLGLGGIVLVLFALIGASSYWVIWELDHKDERPSFATKVRNDLLGLFQREPGMRNVEPLAGRSE